jgi:hypothetical protein
VILRARFDLARRGDDPAMSDEIDPHLRERETEPADELGVVREETGPETAGHARVPTRRPGSDEPGSPAITPGDADRE